MRLENHFIPSKERALCALRYVPDIAPKEIALIYAHGFTAGKYTLDGLAGYLAGKGYEGLTFDFIGHKMGGTGGELREMAQIVENLQAVLAWSRLQTSAKRIALIGHSMGAAAAMGTAIREAQSPAAPPLAGVACLCMGTNPELGFQSVVGRSMQAQRADYVQGAPIAALSAQIGALLPTNGELGDLPALFIAARQDVLVSVERVERLAQVAGANTRVATIESSHQEAPDKSKAPLLKWLEEL